MSPSFLLPELRFHKDVVLTSVPPNENFRLGFPPSNACTSNNLLKIIFAVAIAVVILKTR